MPPGDPLSRYRLADLAIDVGRRSVRRGGCEIHLSRLSFDILRTLLEAAPNVVSNDELTRAVWRGVVVGPESVTQRMKLLRDALGDDARAPRYIAGLRGHGYRIVPEVIRDSGAPEPVPPARDSWPAQAESPRGEKRLFRRAIPLAAVALAAMATYFAVETTRNSRQTASHPAPALSTASTPPAAPPAAALAPAGQAFSPPPHSVAVLPFLNMSGDPRQEYFSDGLTEELLNSLSRIDQLQVAARTSSFSFKGKDTDVGTIARKLNVRTVLEGSVRRSGHMIRVTAQLNDAVTGFHLWSQTYDRDLGDVLKLQTEIANAVANVLKVTLLEHDIAKLDVGGTRNPAAFDAYLRASKTYWTPGGNRNLQLAIASYGDAIRLDPKYALAYAARSIAVVYSTRLAASTMSAVHAGFHEAHADAREAVALAPDMSEAHLALAIVYISTLEFTPASEEFARAWALAPGNARVLRDYGTFAIETGHGDSGLTALRRAVALDPLNRMAHMSLAYGLRDLRRYAEALTALNETEALDPPEPGSLADDIGITYYLLGEFESARSACEKMRGEYRGPSCLAITYAKLGRGTDAESMLAKTHALNGDTGSVQYSQIYAQWGMAPKALDWLESALRAHDPELESLKVDPLLDPLRKDARFRAIERSLRFPE